MNAPNISEPSAIGLNIFLNRCADQDANRRCLAGIKIKSTAATAARMYPIADINAG